MHRPRHAHTILSIQVASFLLCLNRVLIPAAVLVLLASAVAADRKWLMIGLILAGVALVLVLVQWIFASSGKCPLCMMPVLSRKGCSKHRNARRFGGSHRFPVAMGALFRGQFRCPYCNEPTLLELKPSGAGRHR